MNIRKNIDYSAMFAALDIALSAEMPQMQLCCELGHRLFPAGERRGSGRSRISAQPFPRCFRLLPAQHSPDAGVLSDV